ncbi:YccS family putative transporter [Pasteurella bettyae]|uniref:YccS family putative transporter n=1 Tax=Pasteurella bettyae TaxID=752 RepID=UPI003D2BAB24
MNSLLKKISSDWLSESIIKTLPIFIASNLVAIVIWNLQISELAMPLILGVIAGGLVDLDSSILGRIKNLILSLLAFALSSIGAQISLGYGWIFIPAVMVSAFLLVMLGAIGQRYSTIAFGTLVVAIYTCLSYNPQLPWHSNMTMILIGATIYGLVSIVVYLCFPNRMTQENLAKAYDALGAYLQAKSEYFDPDDDNLNAKQLALANANRQVMLSFDMTRASLFYRLQGHNRQARTHRLLRYYFIAQDILERASSSHYQYHELFKELGNTDLMFRFQRVMELQAIACQHIANALRHREIYEHSPRGQRALQGLLTSLQYNQENGLVNAYRWQMIAENLRHIESQIAQIEQDNGENAQSEVLLSSTRLTADNVSGLGNMLRAIYHQCTFSSQLFRHAIRLSILMVICSAIVPLLNLDSKGYWIALTALFVCQPNYSATKKRLVQRIIGTMLGVIFGFAFQYLSPSLEASLGLMVISSSLYYFFRLSNYGSSTFFITLLVFMSLDIIGLGSHEGILPRLFDTLLGTALAWFAVSFLWPDWKYLNLHRNLKNTLQACSEYLRHIMAQLQFGYNEQLAYRMARREVHNHISALSTVISNMHSEPKKYQAILSFAPHLLGMTYTLLSYISTLGAYRTESADLNHHVEFSALFFQKGKQTSEILDCITNLDCSTKHINTQVEEIDQSLATFEIARQNHHDQVALVLIQQLRMIVQLLPQLEVLVREEQHYAADQV